MANKHAAEKAMRQSARRRTRNRVIRAAARTQAKRAQVAVGTQEASAQQLVREAIRALDQAAQKGVIKKNNAARRKSRLMKKLNQLQAAKN